MDSDVRLKINIEGLRSRACDKLVYDAAGRTIHASKKYNSPKVITIYDSNWNEIESF